MKKPIKVLFVILCIVFIGIFLYSGYKIYETVLAPGGYYTSNKNNKEYQSSYVRPKASATPAQQSGEPEIVLDPETSPIDVDFTSLSQRCEDIVGWLYCPDTVINLPVVRYDDNMFYLHKDIDGNYSSYGTLFVECLCHGDFSDNNTIVYGHHMNDGKMFAKLVEYNYQSYYDEHPLFYLNTPEYNYRIELFAGFVTKMDSDVYAINFDSPQANQEWLDSVRAQSTFQSDVEVIPGDKLITMSTCTYEYDDARYVLIGKMVAIH